MKKIMSLLSALVISVVSFTGISNAADSKKPIVIPTHNWSSQIVMAYVIGGIFDWSWVISLLCVPCFLPFYENTIRYTVDLTEEVQECTVVGCFITIGRT